VAVQHSDQRVAAVGDPDDADVLQDGWLVRVMIETHAHKNIAGKVLPGWGLIDGDTFVLLWSKHKAVWDEVGYTGENVTLNESEIESAKDVGAPTEVEVALARYKLTGKVEPIC
jgi:hypothetical protein